jgi:hypothetical protein
MVVVRRFAWVVFLFVALLATAFGVFPGGWFEDDVDTDATLLTSTYALVAVVLTVAVALNAFRQGEAWAWWALWVWPLFFVIHGVAFFPVDFVFAGLTAVALLAGRPSADQPKAA